MAEGIKLLPLNTEPSKLGLELLELYSDVIENLYSLKCPVFLSETKEALKKIRKLKFNSNEEHENQFYVHINYNKPESRCAYMYSYSVLHTAMVYSQFLKQLKRKEEPFRKLFSKRGLNICCLAGGPAFEAVAVTKAISEFIGEFPSKDVISFTDVHVTVVDICSAWESEVRAVINALQKYPNLYHSKRRRFNHEFLKADLLKPFEDILVKKINEADIVTVVKLGSAVEEVSAKFCSHNLEKMIKKVTECMNEQSCLFILDSDGGKAFRQLVSAIPNPSPENSFGQFLHQKYRLHPAVSQKMEKVINFRQFPNACPLFPTMLAAVSSCMWKKNTRIVKKERNSKKTNNTDVKH